MQEKYELTAITPISPDLPQVTQLQLAQVQKCVQAIEAKHGIDRVRGILNVDTDNLSIVLFNGRNGVDTDKVDSENEKAIEFLKAFDPKISKKETPYSYWSETHIKLSYGEVEAILESLALLEDTPCEPRAIARC